MKRTYRVLGKYKGALVIFGISFKHGSNGACPICSNTTFREYHGWTECDNCLDYAVLTTDLRQAQIDNEMRLL